MAGKVGWCVSDEDKFGFVPIVVRERFESLVGHVVEVVNY
jgi:hypothetical protein